MTGSVSPSHCQIICVEQHVLNGQTAVFPMAVRTDAAAWSSLSWCFVLLLYVWICVHETSCVDGLKLAYTSAELRDIGYASRTEITSDFQLSHNIPPAIARSRGSTWIVVGPGRRRRRQGERRQKWGCRAGLLVRLRKQPLRPALPSLFLSNTRSIVHIADEFELMMAGNDYTRECCVAIITETWLHLLILDTAAELMRLTMHRFDRTGSSRPEGEDYAFTCIKVGIQTAVL